MGKLVEIIEVGPRDGLQNEPLIYPYKKRIEFIKKLEQAGLKRIEVGAFVSPKYVPQMIDSDKVAKAVLKNKLPKTRFSALVPNMRGLSDFLKTDLKEAALFAACTDSFSKKNINCTVDESFERFLPVVQECKKHKIKVRGYLSTVFGCPFEGDVPVKKVVKYTLKLLELGVFEVSLGDTIGVATPKQVHKVLTALLNAGVDPKKIAGHFHDTRSTALSNVIESLNFGVNKFDSSTGGLGGCPYAPGSAGNLATENLVFALDRMGYKTNVDLEKLPVNFWS